MKKHRYDKDPRHIQERLTAHPKFPEFEERFGDTSAIYISSSGRGEVQKGWKQDSTRQTHTLETE
jgi:hypothetical protein